MTHTISDPDDDVPGGLQINAWTGTGEVTSKATLDKNWHRWATTSHMARVNRRLAPPEPVDERDWQHPAIGWGLIVADNKDCSNDAKARGDDLPEPLQKLVQRRNGPIIRYRQENGAEYLRRYYVGGNPQDLSHTAKAGVERNQLPKYLLIWASPARGGTPGYIPWRLQYSLNVARYVGRLHLQGKPLENYINALLNDWAGRKVRADTPVIWATDHNDMDITRLMRIVVAEPVRDAMLRDTQIGPKTRYFSGNAATAKQLTSALSDAAQPPAFVMTTSHGKTGPLHDEALMRATLGLLVDQNEDLLNPEALLDNWQPNGAIWYAHACCSAGSDDTSQYTSLLQPSSVTDLLNRVAGLGAQVAPLPTALLGAPSPLRAFVGHVEPTFDWTLSHPRTKEPLTHSLVCALYNHLYREKPEPVGMAFRTVFDHAGQLFAQHRLASYESTSHDVVIRNNARAAALRTQLGAMDRQSCVILGDPTVALPAL